MTTAGLTANRSTADANRDNCGNTRPVRTLEASEAVKTLHQNGSGTECELTFYLVEAVWAAQKVGPKPCPTLRANSRGPYILHPLTTYGEHTFVLFTNGSNRFAVFWK